MEMSGISVKVGLVREKNLVKENCPKSILKIA